jgi:putative hydrolase of the HAD superfamily
MVPGQDAARSAARSSAAPRIAVFDLGGVVVKICRSWQEGCAAAGVPVRPGAEEYLTGAPVAQLMDRHQCGQLACADFHQQLSHAMQGLYTPQELFAIHRAWTQGDYPGIKEAIDRIHIAGVDTGCLSNTNASHWEQLQSSAALSRVRHQHASHVLGLAKPNAQIYRAFERATGYTASEIIFFDDLAQNVAAAHACGWNAIRVDHTGDTAAQVLSVLRYVGVAT